MKKAHLKYLVILCAALQVSCCGTDKNELTFDLNSMVVRNLSYKDAKVCAGEELFVGFPVAIRYVEDSVILVKETHVEHLVNAIDLKNGSTVQYIFQGRGPKELLGARDITIGDGVVWVSSISDSRLIKMAFDSLERVFRYDNNKYNLSKSGFIRAMPIGNGNFLIQSAPPSARRLEIIDDSCDVLNYSEYFPEINGGNKAVTPNNAFLQSEIAISPNGKQVVVATKSFHEIDIYDSNLNVTKKIKGPIEVKSSFEVVDTPAPAGQRYKQTPLYFMYGSVCANNQGFLVSYTGCEVISEKDFGKYPKNIFSFDWNGKPLVNYCCDFEIISFDVDASGRKLYCLIHNPDTQIIMFNI